jgi:hypothetical protein
MPFHLAAQNEFPLTEDGNTPEEEYIPEKNIQYPDDAVYIINSVDFNIKGRTKPFALIRYIELKIGEELEGNEKFQKYLADKTQLLVNQRVLDSSNIEYTIGDKREDGKYPVDLVIYAVDTWNIIALPEPKYSTSSGLNLKLKARDYNFLGTMNPLRLNIGYIYDENSRSSFLLELESDTPFTAFGFNWNFTFNNYFGYRPGVEEPFYYQNIIGLSMQLPVKRTTLTFSFSEYTILNEENAEKYYLSPGSSVPQPPFGQFQNGLYMSSKIAAAWKIPTGVLIGNFGELTYLPDISFTFNHEFPEWPLDAFRKGPIFGFHHAVGFDKIDWIGNYRDGLSFYLANTFSYDFFNLTEAEKALSISYSLSGQGHFIIYNFFGISANLQFRHWLYNQSNYNYNDNAGDILRGIRDNAVIADYMLSLNLDFPFKILNFVPSKWFKTRKLRFFDFEMHASPIIDIALYHDPIHDIAFNFRNMLVTGGLEIIIFPASFRSLYLRASIGFDLKTIFNGPTDDNWEFFIGIGHHY